MSPVHNRLERFVVGSLLGLLVLMPLPQGSVPVWAAGVIAIWLAVTAFIWGVSVRRKQSLGSAVTKKNALLMVVLLVFAQIWIAVQMLTGITQDAGSSYHQLVLGVSYSLLFVLLIANFNTRKRLTLLLATLVVSGAFQAFYGAAMTLTQVEWLLFGPKTTYIGDATGTFVNRNHLAGYMELTLAAGIGLLMALRDTRSFDWRNILELLMGPKAKLRLALVVMVIALVMSHSRMGNTAFFIGLTVVGAIFVLLDKGNRVRNVLILTSIVLIDILIVSQYFGLEKLKDRIVNTRLNDVVVDGEVVQRANEIRHLVFEDALPLIKQQPLVGHGAGSFEAVFVQVVGEDIRLHFDYAHNDYIQFLIEYGAIGCVPLLIFSLMALWHALQAMRKRSSVYRSGVGFGAAMGIIAIGAHSTTDFNLQIPANAATFITLCAIAYLARYHTKEKRKKSTR